MLKLSRQTDYGILLLTAIAANADGASSSARELAEMTHLPLPMVGKILKMLSRGGILSSQRGIKGGYSLARRSEAITLVDIIVALEGPIALTECSEPSGECGLEESCPVQVNWVSINRMIRDALESITLRDMTRSHFDLVQLGGTNKSSRLSG